MGAVKAILKIIGVSLFAVALLFGLGLGYSTAHGYMTWWFGSTARVTVDGVPNGYLHRNSENLGVIITRTDSSPHQSYLVGLTGKTRLTHCGDWYAPRFPAFPIGDVNPPCLLSGGSDKSKADDGVSSTLIVRPGFVEFYTVQGRKVTASW